MIYEKNTPDNKENAKIRLYFGVALPILIMGLVSFFTDISTEMITSILPLFIEQIGGTAMVLGIITGVTTALANILKGVSGWLSDKINKRKPFVVAGYTISNLAKPFIGLSTSWEQILGFKSIDRFGKGLRTSSRDTLISYYAVEKGKAFGLHRAMDTAGAVVGTLLAFLLLFLSWSYSSIIRFSIVPGIIAIIFIILVKDVNPLKIDESLHSKAEVPKVDKITGNFVKLIIILGVIEFASIDISFVILRSSDYIVNELLYLIPLFYLISNIVYMLFSRVMGSLSDKIGRKPPIIIGLMVLLVCCIILALPVQISIFSLITIVLIFIMYGFYLASVDPISRAYIADLAGKNKRGRAYGLYYLSIGLITMGEAFIFGFIYDISILWAFIYVSILLLICTVIFAATNFSKITKKDKFP